MKYALILPDFLDCDHKKATWKYIYESSDHF